MDLVCPYGGHPAAADPVAVGDAAAAADDGSVNFRPPLRVRPEPRSKWCTLDVRHCRPVRMRMNSDDERNYDCHCYHRHYAGADTAGNDGDVRADVDPAGHGNNRDGTTRMKLAYRMLPRLQ